MLPEDVVAGTIKEGDTEALIILLDYGKESMCCSFLALVGVPFLMTCVPLVKYLTADCRWQEPAPSRS